MIEHWPPHSLHQAFCWEHCRLIPADSPSADPFIQMQSAPVLYFCWHPSQILVMTYAASMACPLRKGCKQQEIQTTAQQGLCPLHSKKDNETDSAEICRRGRISKLNVDDWLLKPQTHRTEMQWCMSPSSFPCHSPQMGTHLDPRRDESPVDVQSSRRRRQSVESTLKIFSAVTGRPASAG